MTEQMEIYSPLFALVRPQREHVKIAIDASLPEGGSESDTSTKVKEPHCIFTIVSNVDEGYEECSLLICKRRRNDSSKVKVIDGMAIGSDFNATITQGATTGIEGEGGGGGGGGGGEVEETLSRFVMTSRGKTIAGLSSDSQGIEDMLTVAREAAQMLGQRKDQAKHTWMEHYIDTSQHHLASSHDSSSGGSQAREPGRDVPIFSRFTTSSIAPARAESERPRPPSPVGKEIRISIGTFNANGQLPTQTNLAPWLHIVEDEPDLLIVGLEEAESLNFSYMIGASDVEFTWLTAIEESMGRKAKEYEKVISKQLMGVMMIVYARKDITKRISALATASVGVGLGGWAANKGAVAVRFELDDALPICFVISHLSAYDTAEARERRRWDYNEIVKRLRFTLYEVEGEEEEEAAEEKDANGKDTKGEADDETKKEEAATKRRKLDAEAMLRAQLNNEPVWTGDDRDVSLWTEDSQQYTTRHLAIMDHSVIFWAGDLNFRLELGIGEVKRLIQKRQFESALLRFDQLRSEMQTKASFEDFHEQPITFAPTYKFDRGTDVYDTSEKQRIPSWTDRVLWRQKQPLVTPVNYESCPSIRISDHKPVLATFVLNSTESAQE